MRMILSRQNNRSDAFLTDHYRKPGSVCMLLPRPKAPKLIFRENCYFLPEGCSKQTQWCKKYIPSLSRVGGVRVKDLWHSPDKSLIRSTLPCSWRIQKYQNAILEKIVPSLQRNSQILPRDVKIKSPGPFSLEEYVSQFCDILNGRDLSENHWI